LKFNGSAAFAPKFPCVRPGPDAVSGAIPSF
jgi:hypothetical protein